MRLDSAFVRYWSEQYGEGSSLERKLLGPTHTAIEQRRYLIAEDLRDIARWKSRGRVSRVLETDSNTIRQVTSMALAHDTPDWMRHHILCILDGVRHPMASAILTVWNPETQTMFDFRAVEALKELERRQALDLELPADFSRGYGKYLCTYRQIAVGVSVAHRDLDRALWKWHKAKMPATWPGCE